MVKESKLGPVETFMMVIGLTIRGLAKASILGPMDLSIMAIGLIIKNMAKARFQRLEIYMKVIFMKTK